MTTKTLTHQVLDLHVRSLLDRVRKLPNSDPIVLRLDILLERKLQLAQLELELARERVEVLLQCILDVFPQLGLRLVQLVTCRLLAQHVARHVLRLRVPRVVAHDERLERLVVLADLGAPASGVDFDCDPALLGGDELVEEAKHCVEFARGESATDPGEVVHEAVLCLYLVVLPLHVRHRVKLYSALDLLRNVGALCGRAHDRADVVFNSHRFVGLVGETCDLVA